MNRDTDNNGDMNGPRTAYMDFSHAVKGNWYFLTVTAALFNRMRLYMEGDGIPAVDPAVIDRLAQGNTKRQELLEAHDSGLATAWDTFAAHASIDSYHRTLFEISISRNVDAFNSYLVRMLTYVLEQNESMLSNGDLKRLKGKTGDDRKAELEKIVEGMSGLRITIKYLSENLGLVFDTGTQDFQTANEYIAVRNLIVHNAGRVNHRNLMHLIGAQYQIGAEFPLTKEFILQGYEALHRMVKKLDTDIIVQFNLFAAERREVQLKEDAVSG